MLLEYVIRWKRLVTDHSIDMNTIDISFEIPSTQINDVRCRTSYVQVCQTTQIHNEFSVRWIASLSPQHDQSSLAFWRHNRHYQWQKRLILTDTNLHRTTVITINAYQNPCSQMESESDTVFFKSRPVSRGNGECSSMRRRWSLVAFKRLLSIAAFRDSFDRFAFDLSPSSHSVNTNSIFSHYLKNISIAFNSRGDGFRRFRCSCASRDIRLVILIGYSQHVLRCSHNSSILITIANGILREWLFHGIDVIFQQSQFFLQSFLVLQCSLGEANGPTETLRDGGTNDRLKSSLKNIVWNRDRISDSGWVSPWVSSLHLRRHHEIWTVPSGKAWWAEPTTRQRRYRENSCDLSQNPSCSSRSALEGWINLYHVFCQLQHYSAWIETVVTSRWNGEPRNFHLTVRQEFNENVQIEKRGRGHEHEHQSWANSAALNSQAGSFR